nr:1,5-anhydro-D-fructose reductase-like [Cherax quadricarinatus]
MVYPAVQQVGLAWHEPAVQQVGLAWYDPAVQQVGLAWYDPAVQQVGLAWYDPAVQQVELHVHFQQRKMQEFCRNNNIVITAYGPLGSPGRSTADTVPRLLDDPVVRLVADRHGVTTAQVLIRFLIQQGIITIPKSTNPQRIKTNGEVWNFSLTEVEMEALKSIDKGEAGRSFTFASFPGLDEHPEFPL